MCSLVNQLLEHGFPGSGTRAGALAAAFERADITDVQVAHGIRLI